MHFFIKNFEAPGPPYKFFFLQNPSKRIIFIRRSINSGGDMFKKSIFSSDIFEMRSSVRGWNLKKFFSNNFQNLPWNAKFIRSKWIWCSSQNLWNFKEQTKYYFARCIQDWANRIKKFISDSVEWISLPNSIFQKKQVHSPIFQEMSRALVALYSSWRTKRTDDPKAGCGPWIYSGFRFGKGSKLSIMKGMNASLFISVHIVLNSKLSSEDQLIDTL